MEGLMPGPEHGKNRRILPGEEVHRNGVRCCGSKRIQIRRGNECQREASRVIQKQRCGSVVGKAPIRIVRPIAADLEAR